MKKCVERRPYAEPEAAARKIVEIAYGLGEVWEGQLFVEKLNWAMLTEHDASPAEWGAGVNFAVERGWLSRHESGSFYRLAQAGRDHFV